MEVYPLYNENTTLPLKVVTTAHGKREYRVHCKKIHKEYFIKNEDCFEVDNTWYRADSGIIVFNHSKNKWVTKLNQKNMVQGIIDFKEKNVPVFGHFDYCPCESVKVMDANTGNTYYCISAEIANKYCREDLSTGLYYYNVSASMLSGFSRIRNSVNNKEKGYNIEDNATEMVEKTKAYNEYKMPINRVVRMFSKMLGDLTFGVEAECIRGYLPEHIQNRTGIVICRDGSLHDADGSQGPEFTTIPLTGAKGVQAMINAGKELTPRTQIDRNCAFHIHLGNLPTTRTFLVSLYRLAYMIQDEIFQMFPYYKIDERKYAGKDKNYCKKLTRLSIFALRKGARDNYKYYIDDNYVRIFTFLSNGYVPCKEYNRTLKVHPKSNEKWNKVARYYWINFMNVIFSKRNTVEFRIHQGTTNPQKMVTWLFICNAIVKTAMLRTGDILKGKKLTLDDVLNYYGFNFKTSLGSQMSDYLKEYVKQRKEYFRNDFEKGDFISQRELDEDKNFNIYYPSVTEMFR